MGEIIFNFYGLTIHAFKIAGGILFLRTGMDMLYANTSRTKTTPKEKEEALDIDDIKSRFISFSYVLFFGDLNSKLIFLS